MPVKCIVSERLKGQRIPRITEENSAEEAICRIPVGVPRMASFDIQAAYHFTDAEFDLDLYATFYNYTDGGSYTVEHECAYNTNVNARNFSWVSWMESVTENENGRIWVCDCEDGHLLCNNLDPEFKRPAIPPQGGAVNIQQIPFNTFEHQLDIYTFDYHFTGGNSLNEPPDIDWEPPSWEPPDADWEPPSWDPPSWEPPSWDPPSYDIPTFVPPTYDTEAPGFIPPEPPWASIDPPTIPPWMLEPPSYFAEPPYWLTHPEYGGGGSYDESKHATCAGFSFSNPDCIKLSHSGAFDSCNFSANLETKCLTDYLCRLFQKGANKAPVGDRTVIVNCSNGELEFRMNPEVFQWGDCKNIQVKTDSTHVWFVPLVEDLVELTVASGNTFNGNGFGFLMVYDVDKSNDCEKMTFKLSSALEDGLLLVRSDGNITSFVPASSKGKSVIKGGGNNSLSGEEQSTDDCTECEKGNRSG